MKPEDILKAAQEQKNGEGEYELKIQSRGAFLSALVALVIAGAMFYVEFLFLHRLDYGKPAIVFAISAASDLFIGFKLKDKKKIIIGICSAVLFVICIIFYVGALMK